MKAILFALALVLPACTANTDTTDDTSPTSSGPAPDSLVSCVTFSEYSSQCTALDPTDSTGVSCDDNVKYSECTDSSRSDYGGGCFMEWTYTEYTISTDCATYEAENPDVFKKTK